MKKNKIIGFFFVLIGILLLVLGIVYSLSHSKKVDDLEPSNSDVVEVDEEKDKIYYCDTGKSTTDMQLGGKTYPVSYNSIYSFSVDSSLKISPIEYTSNITFQNIDDLNSYYSYMVNESNLLTPHTIFDKDESKLFIKYSYENFYLYGGIENFDDSYIPFLEESNFHCQLQ